MSKSRDQIENKLRVLQCQQGDAEAFAKLVDRWQRPLWRHAYRLTGEEDAAWDVLQEAWLTIVAGIRRLDDADAFPKWAYRIVNNKCADWVRKRQKQRNLADRLSHETCPETLDARTTDSHTVCLSVALQRLPGEVRALLSLRYADGYEISEIADILGIPDGTVKSRLYNAREQLRMVLERSEDE